MTNSLSLPACEMFAPMEVIHLDAGFSHPVTLASMKALHVYYDFRLRQPPRSFDSSILCADIAAKFARLIGAQSSEICIVPSTMAAENAILGSLGILNGQGRVITDALHFDGSLYLYNQLAAKGVDVVVLKPQDGRILAEQLRAALDRPTDIVALSLVSRSNGFRHDLDAICALAHANGTLVFADIVQAAGAVPFDVRSSGVDFCACASYKWLMGDFGAGLMYARQELLDVMEPHQYGYRQLQHFSPLHGDEISKASPGWQRRATASGVFAVGSVASGPAVILNSSLDYILALSVEAIHAHRESLLCVLRAGLRDRNLSVLTPTGGDTPLLWFEHPDTHRLAIRLQEEGIFASIYSSRVRVAPSVYNTQADIEKLLAALD